MFSTSFPSHVYMEEFLQKRRVFPVHISKIPPEGRFNSSCKEFKQTLNVEQILIGSTKKVRIYNIFNIATHRNNKLRSSTLEK